MAKLREESLGGLSVAESDAGHLRNIILGEARMAVDDDDDGDDEWRKRR